MVLPITLLMLTSTSSCDRLTANRTNVSQLLLPVALLPPGGAPTPVPEPHPAGGETIERNDEVVDDTSATLSPAGPGRSLPPPSPTTLLESDLIFDESLDPVQN